jgi:hypothetical protein
VPLPVILDYDANGNIVGIEILDASSNLTVADLSTVNFEVNRQLTKAGDGADEFGKTLVRHPSLPPFDCLDYRRASGVL